MLEEIKFYEVSVIFPNLDLWYTMTIKSNYIPYKSETLRFVKDIDGRDDISDIEILGGISKEEVLENFVYDGIESRHVLTKMCNVTNLPAKEVEETLFVRDFL